jgi:protein O-mannosyl-transferase
VYPFRYSYVADHFQYLALPAIVVPAAYGLTLLARRISPAKIGPIVLAALFLTALGAATRRQSGLYRDYETLFRQTLARNPESAFLHNNLGVILMSTGRENEAVTQFSAAVRLTPGSAEYHVNLGLALAQLPGRLPDAMAEYQRALQIDPNFQAAHLNLGLALAQLPGRLPDAITQYQKAIASSQAALRSDPHFWQAHLNLGIAYAQMPDRQDDAIAEYRTALRIRQWRTFSWGTPSIRWAACRRRLRSIRHR